MTWDEDPEAFDDRLRWLARRGAPGDIRKLNNCFIERIDVMVARMGTRRAFAERAGIANSQISRILRGELKLRRYTAQKIVDAFPQEFGVFMEIETPGLPWNRRYDTMAGRRETPTEGALPIEDPVVEELADEASSTFVRSMPPDAILRPGGEPMPLGVLGPPGDAHGLELLRAMPELDLREVAGRHGAVFAVRVTDRWLYPYIRVDDIVMVSPGAVFGVGDIVVFAEDDRYSLRFVEAAGDNAVLLQTTVMNDTCPAVRLPGETNGRVVGVAVGVLRFGQPLWNQLTGS